MYSAPQSPIFSVTITCCSGSNGLYSIRPWLQHICFRNAIVQASSYPLALFVLFITRVASSHCLKPLKVNREILRFCRNATKHLPFVPPQSANQVRAVKLHKAALCVILHNGAREVRHFLSRWPHSPRWSCVNLKWKGGSSGARGKPTEARGWQEIL